MMANTEANMQTRVRRVVLLAVADRKRRIAMTAALDDADFLVVPASSLFDCRQLFVSGLRVAAVWIDLGDAQAATEAAIEIRHNFPGLPILALDSGVDHDACSWTLFSSGSPPSAVIAGLHRHLGCCTVFMLKWHRKFRAEMSA